MTGAAVVPVIRTEHSTGAGTPSDPARVVTTYWSLEGKRLWTEHPADTPRPEPVASRRPTRYEIAAALVGVGGGMLGPYLVAADAVLALWDAPGCRVCGAGVPEGATECGSDHQ